MEQSMSTKMDGIYQRSLFSTLTTITVFVPEGNRYRVLSDTLPWIQLAEVANKHRAKLVNINNGRPLNLRLHLGAYIAQSMNGWTDRETEEMVCYHAGVRLLCGLEGSEERIDHTSIVTFRVALGDQGAEELNQIIVLHATEQGFTGNRLCASDTTVQEAPIAYPTEVGHLKNIVEKLTGIGKKINQGLSRKVEKMKDEAIKIFTEIRLFAKGKKEKIIEKKKKLGNKLRQKTKKILMLIEDTLSTMSKECQEKYQDQIQLYKTMLVQIKHWMKTGFHPNDKILSLWNLTARAINRGKAAKAIEFGRRWIITRLERGYVIGRVCQKLGSDTDANIAEEVLTQFLEVFGEVPELFIYDRGGDGKKNHQLLADLAIKENCIFRRGKEKMKVSEKVYQEAKCERALTEASIAVVKGKYGFNKPRAKSEETCTLKGQFAILGANLNRLYQDIVNINGMKMEIA